MHTLGRYNAVFVFKPAPHHDITNEIHGQREGCSTILYLDYRGCPAILPTLVLNRQKDCVIMIIFNQVFMDRVNFI